MYRITFILLFLSSCFHETDIELDIELDIYQENKNEFFVEYNKVNDPKSMINVMHMSDVHIWSEDSQMNLDYAIRLSLEDGISLSAILCTGDLSIGCDSRTKKTDVQQQLAINSTIFSRANIPPLVQLGNHDANDHDGIVEASTTKQEQWDSTFSNIANKWSQIKWGDRENFRHYHYYDIQHATGNIRIIVLDQLDHDSPVGADGKLIYRCQEDAVYSQKQIDWLCNTALNTPPNTGVIICNHFPFMKRGTRETSFLTNGHFIQGWKLIPEIIKAWEHKQKKNVKFSDSKKRQNITINADFTNYSPNCEFITYLVGHVHHRTHGVVEGYNQLYMMETTLGQGKGTFSSIDRVKKTKTSASLSVLSINRTKKKIYRTIYGAYIKSDQYKNSRIEEITYDLKK